MKLHIPWTIYVLIMLKLCDTHVQKSHASHKFACMHGTVKQYTHSHNCEIAQLQQTTDILQQCQENVILILLHKIKPEWSC